MPNKNTPVALMAAATAMRSRARDSFIDALLELHLEHVVVA